MIYFDNFNAENREFLEEIIRNLAHAAKLRSEGDYRKYIENTEEEFARFNGSRFAIGVNSGTTALELALLSCGISPDDEVIIPSYTYIATGLAVSDLGAKPVFADIQEDTLNISPRSILKNITKKTKAIIAVHIHGNPCEIDEIIRIAKAHRIFLIEDSSHAHGAEYKGKKVGNFGIGCYSNHSSKVLAGIGNSGFITTNDAAIHEKIQDLINVTNDPLKNISRRTPCRMDVLQAAVLKAKIKAIDCLIARRRKIASIYQNRLKGLAQLQKEQENAKHVYRDFVVMVKKREAAKKFLEKQHVETKIRYLKPLHATRYYSASRKIQLPITEAVADRLLWLPISPCLKENEAQTVIEGLVSFIGKNG